MRIMFKGEERLITGCKKSFVALLVVIGLCFLPGRVSAREIPVLMYHHIAWETDGHGTVVTPHKLWNDFMHIRKAGYNPVFFKDILESHEGKKELPAKPLVITFDDGYYSNYQFLFPLLKVFNYKANINIIVGQVGKTPGCLPHFDWEEAREMSKSGLVEFGVHTYDLHGEMGFAPYPGESLERYLSRIQEDINKANADFYANLGFEPYIFCYPYGWVNDMADKLLMENGYAVTLSITKGKTNGLRNIKRKNINERTSLNTILK